MFNDIRYAMRFLARQRSFTLVAIITVALGVGANTAIFSIADSVLFRPLPYANRDRLYALEVVKLSSQQGFGTMDAGDLRVVRDAGVLDSVMELDQVQAAYVRDGNGLQPVRLQPVPAAYLDVLGVRPLHGRNFNETDAGQRAVLLTYRAWLAKYGGNAGVIDTSIPTADGAPLRIVGVLPPSFRAASATVFFTPPDALVLDGRASETVPSPGSRAHRPLARLGPGVTAAVAQARLSALRGTELRPGQTELRLVPLQQMMGRTSSDTLKLLCAAAFLVLLVGCLNLANLVLARGAGRERELSLRASLGAPRWRLVRLLLVENLVLASVGGCLGLCLAYWSFSLLVSSLPIELARSVDPALDTRALIFAVSAALGAGVISGLLPAWRLARTDARAGLQLGRLQGRASRAGRKALLSMEVGVAVVAVIAAVLLGRSLAHLLTKQLGFDSSRILINARAVGRAPTAPSRPALAAQFVRQFEAVRALPDIRSAGALSILPASGAAPDFHLVTDKGKVGGWTVASGFFRTMGIPVIEGREIDDRESFEGAPVGLLNQSAARLLFPDGRVLGRQVSGPKQPSRTIIGVVADWRQSLKDPAVPALYVPFDPAQFRFAQMIVDAPDSPALRDRIRQAVTGVTPDSVVRIDPVSALLDREVAPLRFMLVVIGLFASLTLALAVLGVYGVVAFLAGERLREYGVRVALGATRRTIGILVVRQAVVPIAVGLAAGLIVATWTSRLLAAQLFEVTPADGMTFAATALLLFASGVAAAAIPARRATRVDPMIALRAE